ncbi:SDR family oxidoreductase [Roseococcus sp.]|uniref:SDR family oxidoreductase n=1 Tax=Roseococcus sp. TaxID=2109646 RepID=UPI003BAA2159
MDSKRTAIVTGAARGMGLAIARRLGQGGHHVVLIDVLADEVAAAAEALRSEGIDATGLPLDLGDEAQRAALPQRLGARFESVAVLVNNAAISPKRDGRRIPAGEIPLDEWERVVQINLTAPFRLIQLCLPPMRARRWGRIVNIASRAGRSPGGVAGAHYVTTKTGILGMTRAFGKEIASDGVTVNAIAPGRIETPMSAGSPPEVLAGVLKTIPVGRFGTPEEVAALTSFLAGDEAGFITGATFDINGGVLMI